MQNSLTHTGNATMTNIDPSQGHVKTIVCPEILTIHAFDGTGHFASVEVNLTPRWRQGHGVGSFSELVEIALDNGAQHFPRVDFEDGGFVPGGYGLRLSPFDMIALSDPYRPTFLSVDGLVVQCLHEGGSA